MSQGIHPERKTCETPAYNEKSIMNTHRTRLEMCGGNGFYTMIVALGDLNARSWKKPRRHEFVPRRNRKIRPLSRCSVLCSRFESLSDGGGTKSTEKTGCFVDTRVWTVVGRVIERKNSRDGDDRRASPTAYSPLPRGPARTGAYARPGRQRRTVRADRRRWTERADRRRPLYITYRTRVNGNNNRTDKARARATGSRPTTRPLPFGVCACASADRHRVPCARAPGARRDKVHRSRRKRRT